MVRPYVRPVVFSLSPTETRAQVNQMDAHEEHIKQLQSDVLGAVCFFEAKIHELNRPPLQPSAAEEVD